MLSKSPFSTQSINFSTLYKPLPLFVWGDIINKNDDGEQSLIKNLFFFSQAPSHSPFSLLCFYTEYKFTFNYKFSAFLRRKSFLFCYEIQVLLESNLVYFIIDSLSQYLKMTSYLTSFASISEIAMTSIYFSWRTPSWS